MVPISKERENREEQDAVLFVRTKYDMVTLAIFLGVSRRIHYTYEHHTYMYQDQILFTFFSSGNYRNGALRNLFTIQSA